MHSSSLIFQQVPRGSLAELLVLQDALWSPLSQKVLLSEQERALGRSCTHSSTAHALQGHSTPGLAALPIKDWKVETLKINDCCLPTLLIPLNSGLKQLCREVFINPVASLVKLRPCRKETGLKNNCSSQKTDRGY